MVADVRAPGRAENHGVELRMRIDQTAPPSGEVMLPDGRSARFAGWLQLLGILTSLVDSPAETPGDPSTLRA